MCIRIGDPHENLLSSDLRASFEDAFMNTAPCSKHGDCKEEKAQHDKEKQTLMTLQDERRTVGNKPMCPHYICE